MNLVGYRETLLIIQRMKLDAHWSREPSKIRNNMRSINTLISTREASGFDTQLPALGPYPVEDVFGYGVVFVMLVHSRNTW